MALKNNNTKLRDDDGSHQKHNLHLDEQSIRIDQFKQLKSETCAEGEGKRRLNEQNVCRCVCLHAMVCVTQLKQTTKLVKQFARTLRSSVFDFHPFSHIRQLSTLFLYFVQRFGNHNE